MTSKTGRQLSRPIRCVLRNLRSRFVDFLRASGYAALALWAVLFLLYPPESFVGALDVLTRVFWLSITFTGASAAALGALLRIDIKMEFPGLLFTLIGPLFYFASQLYYVLFPAEGINVVGRLPLVVYAVIPGLLVLPRIFELYADARKLTIVRRRSLALAEQLKISEGLLHPKGEPGEVR